MFSFGFSMCAVLYMQCGREKKIHALIIRLLLVRMMKGASRRLYLFFYLLHARNRFDNDDDGGVKKGDLVIFGNI